MAEIISGDGSIGGGTVSSEDDPNASASPADGAAPQAPQRSELQEKALALKDAIMQRGLGGEVLTQKERQRMHELSKFAAGLSPSVPLELRMAQEPDERPVDSQRSALEESASKPIPQQERDRLIASATLHGAPKAAGEAAMAVAEDLGMDVADAGTFMKRIGHFAQMGHVGPDGIKPLSPEDEPGLTQECARLLGGMDKLRAITTEVREFLQERGLLEKLEKHGIPESIFSRDPRTLLTLLHAAHVWKAKGRK